MVRAHLRVMDREIPVSVVTLVTTPNPFREAGELYCLQALRQSRGLLRNEQLRRKCRRYCQNTSEYAAHLLRATQESPCDTLVGVPSCRARLLRPYLAAAHEAHPGITDVTKLVRRDRLAGSKSGLSFAERHAAHTLLGPLPTMHRLLVVDDVLGTGQSVAHVITLFAQHLQALPEIVIAAPLWVIGQEPDKQYLR